jgi:hypothetical protein
MPELTLGRKQKLFARLVGQLLGRIYEQGYECSLGEVKRSDEQSCINSYKKAGRAELAQHIEAKFPALAIAISNNGKGNGILLSLHRDQLALDLNLFKDDVWCQDTASYQPFGEWWEQLHELCAWGGRFGDPGHFSVQHQGRK